MRKPMIIAGLAIAGILLITTVAIRSNRSSDIGTSPARPLMVPSVMQASSETPVLGQTPVIMQSPTAALEPTGQARPQTRPMGVTAITPPVTEASVRDYITRNNTSVGGGVTASNLQVESIQFMTIAELKPLLKDPFLDNFPADTRVVYVTLLGDFSVEGQPRMQSAFKVFSAETGNEIMGGAR